GDDFIFIIPFDAIPDVCGEVLEVFDTLTPYQYNEQDRRAGYYFGKDRRGQLHRVPLMTLSIGIVTNQHRRFAHPAQVSELATEMKSYAKTQPGSVFVVDRRHPAPRHAALLAPHRGPDIPAGAACRAAARPASSRATCRSCADRARHATDRTAGCAPSARRPSPGTARSSDARRAGRACRSG